MEKMDISKLRIYSYGKVAENKPLNSKVIQVTPTEILPMVDGELKSNPQSLEVTGTRPDGTTYSSAVLTDNVLEATWFPLGSNRATAPDVRRDEEVLIWRYADTDKYYWTDTGLTEHLRRLETVTYRWSATTEDVKELTYNNTYSLQVSTHGKHVTLHTSSANGEPYEYTVQINAAEGAIVIQDNVGNLIDLDSAETCISFTNADHTDFRLDKQNISASCEGSMSFTANQNVSFKCKDWNLTCTNMAVKASNVTYTVPTSTFSGKVTCKSISAASGTIGGVTFADGLIECQGINSSGSVNAPNIR